MEIRPFKAFRFNKEVVGDTGSCIAPPYDVIDQTTQQKLYDRNPHNIVRIIKGKSTPTDTDSDNQYTRAADFLNKWIAEGALKQDAEQTIYAYVQDFTLAGSDCRRFTFIASGKLALKPTSH